MTRLYAVIGCPVARSWSPAMMNAAFGAAGIDATYVALAVEPAALGAAVEGIRALGVAGVNVTIPHKESLLPLLDDLAPSARVVGACNVVAADGRWLVGHNTDADGFVDAIRASGRELAGARVLLLGAGGAARGVAAGLATAGVQSIGFVARRPDRARTIIDMLAPALGVPSWSAALLGAEGPELEGVDLLVNCTPAGMQGGPDGAPLAAACRLERLAPRALVADLVYRPRETPLLARARSLGIDTMDGIGMLLHQGARAFSIWTGKEAPLGVMRRTLEELAR